MKEGFYWTLPNGVVQVAYYSHGMTDDRPFTVSGI